MILKVTKHLFALTERYQKAVAVPILLEYLTNGWNMVSKATGSLFFSYRVTIMEHLCLCLFISGPELGKVHIHISPSLANLFHTMHIVLQCR